MLFLAINGVSRAQKARGTPALERTLGYHIWYFPENTTNLTETVNTTHKQLELTLGAAAYRVSVVAYNALGQSPAATLRIPAAAEEGESSVTFCRDAAVQGSGWWHQCFGLVSFWCRCRSSQEKGPWRVWGEPGQWAPEAMVRFQVTTPSPACSPRGAWDPLRGSLWPRAGGHCDEGTGRQVLISVP